MTDSELRKILKDTSPINMQTRWDTMDLYPKRSKVIIEKINAANRRLKKYTDSHRFKLKIRKFANQVGYSDVAPFEVINIISDKTVEIRAMSAEITRAPKNFNKGGFCGHFSDNHSQTWKCTPNPQNSIIRIRLSKALNKWRDSGGRSYRMSDKPQKFHDYNF